MKPTIETVVLQGDHAPPCFGVCADRGFYSFEAQYGRPAILLLVGSESAQQAAPTIEALSITAEAIRDQGADLLLLVDDDPRKSGLSASTIRSIDCGDFLHRCGVRDQDTLLLILDRNLRIMFRTDPRGRADLAEICMAHLATLAREAPRTVPQPAPAVILPNLLSHQLCGALIEKFQRSAAMDGEVCRTDAAGIARNVIDHHKKRRLDMPIGPDDALGSELETILLRRCVPEIAKAFQVTVAHLDRILVSRYDAGAGWFRRHRDNTAANVAFRQFALSVNLNAGEYEGGHLLFPEYNDDLYCPPTGGGLIFSTAILHEAAPVTSGCRYVLLTFFHSEAAELYRQTYLNQAGPRIPGE